MRLPDEVAAMLRLHGLGWGTRRIAAALGCNRETVQRYLAAGGWAPYRVPERSGALSEHTAWLSERFRRHRGNADVCNATIRMVAALPRLKCCRGGTCCLI